MLLYTSSLSACPYSPFVVRSFVVRCSKPPHLNRRPPSFYLRRRTPPICIMYVCAFAGFSISSYLSVSLFLHFPLLSQLCQPGRGLLQAQSGVCACTCVHARSCVCVPAMADPYSLSCSSHFKPSTFAAPQRDFAD